MVMGATCWPDVPKRDRQECVRRGGMLAGPAPHGPGWSESSEFLLPWSFSKLCAKTGVARAGWMSLQVGLRFRLYLPSCRLCLRMFEGLLVPQHHLNLVGKGHQGPKLLPSSLLGRHSTHL